MKLPKDANIRIDTEGETLALNIVAKITTKAQANELAAAIKKFSALLDGEKRMRKPRVVAGAAAAE